MSAKLMFWQEPTPEWMSHASCRGTDPDLFFPVRGDNAKEAKAVCRTCPVSTECLSYALERRELFGVWGGTCEADRRLLRRELREAV